MQEAVLGQLYFFLGAVWFGACLLLVYDGIRSFRIVFRHKLWIVSVEDVLYWIFVGFLCFRFLCWYNWGELRGFFFLGLIIGMAVYYILISPKVLEGLVFLLHNIRRVFGKIFRIIRHPFAKAGINMRWRLKQERKNVKIALMRKGHKRGETHGEKDKQL